LILVKCLTQAFGGQFDPDIYGQGNWLYQHLQIKRRHVANSLWSQETKKVTVLSWIGTKTFNNPGEAASFLKEFKSKVDHEAWIYSHR
jgi:hypothetical protein